MPGTLYDPDRDNGDNLDAIAGELDEIDGLLDELRELDELGDEVADELGDKCLEAAERCDLVAASLRAMRIGEIDATPEADDEGDPADDDPDDDDGDG